MTSAFSLLLLFIIGITGMIFLMDLLWLRKSYSTNIQRPLWIDFSRKLFAIAIIIFMIRGFIVEPFNIPSSSLEPTLAPGDLILVNKFIYGFKLPIWNKQILSVSEPAHGAVIVFRWPEDINVDFIKRVVGIPGDRISYINKRLYINGQEIPLKPIKQIEVKDKQGKMIKFEEYQEDLLGIKHDVLLQPDIPAHNFKDIFVPKNHYFVMGDNRDDSRDSRYWGFVSNKDLVGKAMAVLFSFNVDNDNIRWQRIGKVIH